MSFTPKIPRDSKSINTAGGKRPLSPNCPLFSSVPQQSPKQAKKIQAEGRWAYPELAKGMNLDVAVLFCRFPSLLCLRLL